MVRNHFIIAAVLFFTSARSWAAGELNVPVSTAVQIRRASPRDFPEMAKTAGFSTQEALRTFLNDPTRIPLVAVFDHQVIGIAFYQEQSNRIFLSHLNVDPNFANRGVAKKLAAEVSKVAEEGGPVKTIEASLPLQYIEPLNALRDLGYATNGTNEDRVNFRAEPSKVRAFNLDNLTEKTFYQRLGVSDDADAKTIRAAYEKLRGQQLNPQIQKLLDEAYAVLSVPKKRAIYDEKVPRFPKLNQITSESVSSAGDVALRDRKPYSNNLYERLAVPANSSRKAIRKAYREAVYATTDPNDLVKIHQAYAVLGDSQWRDRYDSYLTGPDFGKDARLNSFLEVAPINPPTKIAKTTDFLSYDIYLWLGVDKNADWKTIQDAFDEKREEANSARYDELYQMAYKILRDPTLKTYYDSFAKNMSVSDRERLIAKIWIDDGFKEKAQAELAKKGIVTINHRVLESKDNFGDDFYRILGVPPHATPDEIRQAYAYKRGPGNGAVENAYQVLSHKETRIHYDSIRERLSKSSFDERDEIMRHLVDISIAAKRLDALEKNPTTDGLVKFIQLGVPDLSDAPPVLEKFYELVDQITAKPLKAISLRQMIELMQAMKHAHGMIPSFDEELLRARIARSAMNTAKQSGGDMAELLREYLAMHPPDANSEMIRAERDKMVPKLNLVPDSDLGAANANCDGGESLL